jgi:hypothetical protein
VLVIVEGAAVSKIRLRTSSRGRRHLPNGRNRVLNGGGSVTKRLCKTIMFGSNRVLNGAGV